MVHLRAGASLEQREAQRSRSVSGLPLRLRYARQIDAERIAAFLQELSPGSLERRYLTPKPLSASGARMEATRMLAQAERAGAVLLAMTPTRAGERLVGVGELAIDPLAATRAELALVVRDDYQADGIGTLLARALVAAAAQFGVLNLHVDLAPSNEPMRRLIRKLGMPYSLRMGPGAWTFALDLA